MDEPPDPDISQVDAEYFRLYHEIVLPSARSEEKLKKYYEGKRREIDSGKIIPIGCELHSMLHFAMWPRVNNLYGRHFGNGAGCSSKKGEYSKKAFDVFYPLEYIDINNPQDDHQRRLIDAALKVLAEIPDIQNSLEGVLTTARRFSLECATVSL